jgi:multidrug efflux pump
VRTLSDRTETVRASVNDVQLTLLLSVVLVVAVIYLFLRSWRATVIPGVAVPLSLVGTFGVMYLLGYSLNNLSLMALTISTGFVVDDAIVMIENIARYVERGDPPLQAALEGSRQIGFTIVSLTVSLVAVLIPLLFMGGLIGRLFREFAVTLSVAIFMSAILSLTLTAMMCAFLLGRHERPGAVARASERAFTRLLSGYDRTLRWVLAHQPLTLAVTVATLALTFLLAVVVPKGFFPQQDTGLVQGITQASADISFRALMERQQAAAEVVLADPDVASVASFIGADGTNETPNTGRLSITLKPRDQRSAGAAEIIDRLHARLAQLTGIAVYLQSAQDLTIDTRVSRTPYQYTLEDPNLAELTTWAPRVLARLQALPELRNVASDQQSSGLQLHVDIDRDTAARMGILPQAIDDVLYDAFGQRQVSTIFTQLNQYRVILEVRPADQQDPAALSRLYVRAQTGDVAPLSTFAHFETRTAPLAIAHQGQFPAVTISFDTAPGVSLGAAVRAVEANLANAGLPPGVRGDFVGTALAFGESLRSEPILILAALVTVYIVLGVLYESYIHPVTILSTLPSAGVGALLALMLTGTEFTIIALIGIILLIGIVKKNAIMMIDFALEAERNEGRSTLEAIHQACLLRFRPIMMTTLAALLGGLPLALGSGTGSELRRPLGISIVGGLLVSQLLTLYTTPVIYLYMARLGAWLRGRSPGRVPADAGT